MNFLSRFWNWIGLKSDLSQNIQVIQEIFNIVITDPSPYHLSLIHRSSNSKEDNERLELLGDAVLDLVVVDHLYLNYPELDEGQLTKLKSKLVSREHLSALAIRVGLAERLTLVKQKELSSELLIGNVFEALFGAIYLEQGFGTCRTVALRMFTENVKIETLLEDLLDAKSKLLEWAQKHKCNISFSVKEEPRDAAFRFTAQVKYEKQVLGQGSGNSKKKAEMEASARALNTIRDKGDLSVS